MAIPNGGEHIESMMHIEPTPIWMAALIASGCHATAADQDHDVRWHQVSGRAVYTNTSASQEVIQPFGVHLQKGDTVAVTWVPGDTAYTVCVYQ